MCLSYLYLSILVDDTNWIFKMANNTTFISGIMVEISSYEWCGLKDLMLNCAKNVIENVLYVHNGKD